MAPVSTSRSRIARSRGRLGLAAAVVASLSLLAACGSEDVNEAAPTRAPAPGSTPGSTPGSASAGGTITVYSGRSETLIQGLIDQFEQQSGITVEVRYGDSGELAAQILTEGDASPADVFFAQDAGALGAVEAAGLYAGIEPAVLDLVPAAYRSANGGWVGTSGRVRAFVVNPELAPNPPNTVDGLLDPAWKGKIGFAPTNASWQSFVTGLRVLRGDAAAREWLEAFASQQPVAFEKNAAVRDAVNAGEVAIGLVNHYYLYEKIAAEGADAVTAVNVFAAPGDPGGLVNVAGAAVIKSSADLAAANAFVAYLLGTEGQTYVATKTFEYPLVESVPASDVLPSFASLQPPQIDLSDLATIAATQEMLSDVGLLTL